MQYTVRDIPAAVDAALRQRARAADQSLNQATVQALIEGTGANGARRKRRSLGDIARTWRADKAFDAAIEAQDRVDEALWK